ncbi:Protein CBG14647 [Caenorhabditis briggsae]|uniref:Protein CBG14647 n=1 Tax=Caenorhabditis briggsae TaxID=6238 RepID=A8XKD1_CAEBR|nr:Protein CBG14647 [Caenorhabditis briggsae]CAP33105.2 Protein CBG14647 [Caenorhabditis briggsae]
MKFLALIVVLAISLNVVTACTPSTNGMCNPDLLQCCGLQLKSDLGLSNCYGILAFEPECHRQEIENMYINGISGLMKVCDDAVKVVSMYKQFGFACGAGFEGFANNDACMSQIFATKQTQINSCRAKFANNILADYKNHCMYFEQYTGCFNALFDHSSCNAESTWWGCEYARQSGRVVLHDCNLQCSTL